MSIGGNIKKLRELRNYNQRYMADELRMTTAGYGKIERDQTDISLKKLERIAEILETNVQTILDFDSDKVFNVNVSNNDNMVNNGNQSGYVNNQKNFDRALLEAFVRSLLKEKDLLEKLKS